jgi:hypothetical protein
MKLRWSLTGIETIIQQPAHGQVGISMLQVFQNFRVGRGGHRWLFKINRSLACSRIGYKLRDKCIKIDGVNNGKLEVLTNGIKKWGHHNMAR